MQAQCPNQRTLFLKGVDEYTSGEDEPSEREEEGEDDRVAPLEGEFLMIRRTLNNHPSTSIETQRENIFHTRCNILENICSLIGIVDLVVIVVVLEWWKSLIYK